MENSRSRPFRLLIVDDEPRVREGLLSFFQKRNFEVTEAEDGEAALEIIALRGADAVVSDIRMPRLDGIGLLRSLHEKFPAVDVVLVTGHADTETAIEAARHRAVDYIRKPYDLAELLCILERIRTRRELERRIEDQNRELAKAKRMAAIGDVTAAVMRELTDPTTVLLGNARFLEEHVLPGLREETVRSALQARLPLPISEAERAVAAMRRAAERLAAIAERSGCMRSKGEVVSGAEVVNCLAKVMSALSERGMNHVAVESVLEAEEIHLECAEEELYQILLNLLENAFESFPHIHRRGNANAGIRLTARRRDEKEVEIVIEDDGRGVPEELRERLFEPFMTHRTNQPGRGLGCFLAYRMAESLGGGLSYEPLAPHGSRFTLLLPHQRGVRIVS